VQSVSSLHPVRIAQLNSGFKKECDEYRKTCETKARLKRPDGAQLAMLSQDVSLPGWAGMSFEDLQAVVYSRLRNSQEVAAFVRFWDGPRQIFSFEHGLAEMLAATDVADVPWDSLRFPYDEFFLHFGCVLDNSVDNNGRLYKVDGAYVLVQKGPSFIEGFNPGALHIRVSTRLVRPTYDEAIASMPKGFSLTEPTYKVSVSGEPGETVGAALERSREVNLGICRRLDADNLLSAKDMARAYGVGLAGLSEAKDQGLEEKRYLRGEKIAEEAVSLVFNCIAYLTSVPERLEAAYPEEAPKSLIEKIEKAPTPKKRSVLTKNMDNLGFTKVVLVKDPTPPQQVASAPTGKTVRTHWRRGHWRSQPCGSGLVKRVLIWIRPCLVNADKAEADQVPGHIYSVPGQRVVSDSASGTP
jgi:hypothetical protein